MLLEPPVPLGPGEPSVPVAFHNKPHGGGWWMNFWQAPVRTPNLMSRDRDIRKFPEGIVQDLSYKKEDGIGLFTIKNN